MSKVFVLGIDGAPPQLVFDKWIDELPNLKKLKDNGLFGRIKSTIPPTTCVAWTSFFSGAEPSQFGVYSYTIRNNFEYKSSRLVNSRDVKIDMLWDVLKEQGKKSIIFGVPLTYPIEKDVGGLMIGGFLSPSVNEETVYPKAFLEEVRHKFPDYMFDVDVGLMEKENKQEFIDEIYKFTKQNVDLTIDCIKNKEWDLFATILIGTDRMEHSFWSYIDETHRNFKGETKYRNVLLDYFKFIDEQIGRILEVLPEDVTVIVSSDHGMDKMNFRFNLNDWLIKEGYLVMKDEIKEIKKLNMEEVDWSKTKAFSVGGYLGRIYFNLEGREPEGIVGSEEYESLQNEISSKLKSIKDDNGNEMNNVIYFSQDIYSGEFKNEAPDVIVYFDNLLCGVNNDIGNDGLYSDKTLKGSQDAGHAPEGVFIMNSKKGDIGKLDIIDVAPTILKKFGLNIPKYMKGDIIDE